MSALAERPLETPTFLDDLTPDSGLALRRWTTDEFRRITANGILGAGERLELLGGEILAGDGRTPRLFDRDEYYGLAEHGILGPEERTELIHGRIIQCMSPMGRPHCVAVIKTASALSAAFGSGFFAEQQMPLQLSSGLEPQPDVMVLPGTPDDYEDEPGPEDILLLVEVSDTTLRYDRGTKARMYAAEGIPDHWIVHLRKRTLEVRRQPENGEYLSLDVYDETESVAPLAAPNFPVSVASLLPLVRSRVE